MASVPRDQPNPERKPDQPNPERKPDVVCPECGGSGTRTRLGGDWGKTPDTTVPCWRCQPQEKR